VHVIAVTTWVGGVLAMVSHATRGAVMVVSAFSTVALLCFLAVGASGVAALGAQLAWAELVSAGAYKWLVLAKLAGLVALGLCGAAHRRHTLRRLHTGHPSAFWVLAAGEVVLMAAIVGTAAVLGQTAR
jgi:putative copper export protein